MSMWTSKNAILRDLSEAQGRGVPVDIVNAVVDGEKPPTPNFVEETEEEYFEHCMLGAGDALPAPDFGLIKQMLNVVQLSNTSDDEGEENIVLNDQLTSEINITKGVKEDINHGNKKKTKRMGRNVAVESILQAIGKENVNENQVKMDNNVLKLEDCRVIDNNKKTVNNISPQNVSSRLNSPANNRPLALEPVNMFRKKSPSKKVVTKEEIKPPVGKDHNVETYKPSELASEYYKKYVERVRIREAVQDDIWTKAEKKMKEIEAQKKLQASKSTQSSSKDHETDVTKIWDEINLPQRRHLLTGDCVVCKVFSQRGYHIDMTD